MENSQPFLLQIFSSSVFSFFFFWHSNYAYAILFEIFLPFLDVLVFFFLIIIIFFFCLHFSLATFNWPLFKLTDFCLGCTYSVDEPDLDIFHSLKCFCFLAFPLILKKKKNPSFCLYNCGWKISPASKWRMLWTSSQHLQKLTPTAHHEGIQDGESRTLAPGSRSAHQKSDFN